MIRININNKCPKQRPIEKKKKKITKTTKKKKKKKKNEY